MAWLGHNELNEIFMDMQKDIVLKYINCLFQISYTFLRQELNIRFKIKIHVFIRITYF